MPRPSKLTPEIQEKICEYLAKGVTIENIAAAVGIGESTFYDWQQRGENAKSGKYSEFVEEIARARKQAQILAEQVAVDSLSDREETTKSVDEVVETRLRTIKHPDGSIEKVPYEYRKFTKRTSQRTIPASGDYALKYLSRRSPKRWADTQKHAGPDGGDLTINVIYEDILGSND